MKKVSFPLASKPSSTPPPPPDKPKPPNNFIREEDEQEENPPTTEFITEFNPSETLTHQPTLIIPPLPNTWQPHNTLTSNFESLSTDTLKNESSDDTCSIDSKLLQKLREDIKTLPEHKEGLEEFAEIPVEGFGKAVLTGYGWCEGKGIGKNHAKQEDVKVVQYQGRTGRQGLGFVPTTD